MTLGDVIKEYRQKKGISMETFAKASGLSKGYISMLEKNMNPSTKQAITPSIATYRAVSKAMGRSVDDLILAVDGDSPISLDNVADPTLSTLTDNEQLMIQAYRAAPHPIQAAVDGLLEPYKAQNPTTSENVAG